ncbi:MAG: L-seryl-tRNA(Sec) selenium transferase [Acidimicrobiia bacterium]
MRSSEQPRPPSIDALARSIADTDLPAPMLVEAARQAVAAGDPDSARSIAETMRRRLLQPVVNATGVLLHTNLGRAPLAQVAEATATNLELDLDTGKRGSRNAGVGDAAALLCGAEAAMVVNNGAAALLLALSALAAGREVAVSRGEAVEIGGGFRVPEIAAQSGARLIDVGTTNRTRVADYRAAIDASGADVACVLKVHPSNFRIDGFTEAASTRQLGLLPVPLVVDLGSGLVDAACPWLRNGPPPWLNGEPAARQTLADGAALVTFSGDKLLGGPQAGIIAGRADLVARCAGHPLARALRPGAMVLSALQEVLLTYLRRDVSTIPFWEMATVPVESLRTRAEAIVAAISASANVSVVNSDALVGAGSAPGVSVPSVALRLEGDHGAALRNRTPPVIARVVDGATLLDLRSVNPSCDHVIVESLSALRDGDPERGS